MTRLFDDLSGAYAWLNSQVNYERQLGQIVYNGQTFELEGFRRRLERLGDPQRGLRTLHIAGTRGKGSAALALEAVLQGAGWRTAVYTSPHLHEYRERIRIDGKIIDPERFTALLHRVALDAETDPGDETDLTHRPFKTVFEHLTALFFMAARESQVDWTIVETGLGGRLDATNALDPGPVLLTRIGLEHTRLLGDTIAKIAAEKAAILKPGGWAVGAAQDPAGGADEVFAARAAAAHAPLESAPALCPIRQVEPHAGGLRLELAFRGRPLTLNLGLYGPFQAENIQNALALLGALMDKRQIPPIPEEVIVTSLERLRIPGRMEKVAEDPELFADGGHCPTAAAALARAMDGHFGRQPAGLLVGMMQDKDHDGFFRALASWPHWAWAGLYRTDSPRAMAAEDLAAVARRHFRNIRVYENLEHALESLSGDAEKGTRVTATGTLYSIAGLQQWGRDHGSRKLTSPRPAQAEQKPDHRHP